MQLLLYLVTLLFLLYDRFSCSLCYYALSFGVADLAGDIFINNFVMCMMEGLAYIFCFVLAWWGRKLTTVVTFTAGGVSLLLSLLITLYASGE